MSDRLHLVDKKIPETFGGFGNFVYFCSIVSMSGKYLDPKADLILIQNQYKYEKDDEGISNHNADNGGTPDDCLYERGNQSGRVRENGI